MEEQYRFFNHDGVLVDQVLTSVERAYGITTETTAKCSVSVFDEKWNPFTFNYGNSILCENSDGLLPWVGMIDLLGADRGIGMCWAWTPEHWFGYRRGPRRLTLKGRAGEIFAQMIEYINKIENTPLVVGDIFTNTAIMEETLNPVPISENLKRIVTRSGEGYRWRPEVVRGKLKIYCDWFPGSSLNTGLILQDGYNITPDHPMTMYPPTNDHVTYGSGTDWATRLCSQPAIDQASVDRYGLRQTSTSVSSKVLSTVEILNRLSLEKFKEPQYKFPLSVLNEGDTFKRLLPGAVASYTQLVGQAFSNDGLGFLSFDTMVRLMNFDPMTQTVGVAI
jgi:hypothetical protein